MGRFIVRVRVVVRSLLRFRSEERDLSEELQFHQDREVEDRVRAGASPAEARLAAIRAMGPVERSREECRDLRPTTRAVAYLGDARRDVRHVWRLFRRHPGPTTIAVGGLGLAMAVAVSVFAVVDASLLRPYGMDDPASVFSVSRPDRPAWIGWSPERFLRMREGATAATVEAARPERARVGAAADPEATSRRVLFVTGGYLPMLGGRPALGRSLAPSDDRPGAQVVAVISHYYWQTELQSRDDVVGSTLWINRQSAVVVGVLEPGFTGPVDAPPSIWIPWAAFEDVTGAMDGALVNSSVEVLLRIHPGASAQAVEANLHATLNSGGSSTAGGPTTAVWLYSAASPLSGYVDDETYLGLVIAFVVVALVLALASVNATSLLLAAAVVRRREFGVRRALGAGRGRLIAQVLHEALLLGLSAGAIGFVVSIWLCSILGALLALPPETDLAPGGKVLLFTAAASVLCGLSAGLSPARWGTRGSLISTLPSHGHVGVGPGIRSGLRRAFLGAQAAASVLLLVVAIALTQFAIRASTTTVGFDAGRLLGASFSLPRSDFDEPAYLNRALGAVRALPGVESVSMSQTQPFGQVVERDRFVHDGRPFSVTVFRSDAAFFSTLGLDILHGRTFTDDEVASEAPVALISEAVSRAFFGDVDPLGQSIAIVPAEGTRPRPQATVIGVVADAMVARLDAPIVGTIYQPVARQRSNPPGLMVRTTMPAATLRAVEEALTDLDPRARAYVSQTSNAMEAWTANVRRGPLLIAPAALLALVLSFLGIYGVTTFIVGQRLPEVSIRMALGASAFDIRRLLMADGLRPIVLGCLIGLALAVAVGQTLADWVEGVNPSDPTAIGLALGTLLGGALVAVMLPTRRALRASPATLLRNAWA